MRTVRLVLTALILLGLLIHLSMEIHERITDDPAAAPTTPPVIAGPPAASASLPPTSAATATHG